MAGVPPCVSAYVTAKATFELKDVERNGVETSTIKPAALLLSRLLGVQSLQEDDPEKTAD